MCMKKFVVRFLMLLFVLGMSANAAWGQEATIYLASLKAQADPASTGSGQVKLTWLDITGRPMYVDLAKQINYFGFGDASWMAKDYAYDGPAATAQVLGGTMIALDGMEVPMEMGGNGSQIYMTSFLYFHAETEPANGSYLESWNFNDPQITRMTGNSIPPAPVDPMGEGSEENPYKTPCFKVLPKQENSAAYTDAPVEPSAPVAPQSKNYGSEEDYNTAVEEYNAQLVEYNAQMLTYYAEMQTWMETYYNPLVALAQDVVQNQYNALYALFSKYLLSNPLATSANLEATPNATKGLTVTVEVNGDASTLDAEDFATFTFTNNGNIEWTYDLAAALEAKEVVSAQKTRITIPVTYTYKNTGYGLKNTTMTISMAGESASTLNVNMSVNALNPDRPEAFLLEGKDDASPESGDLADILATDISGYIDPIVKLNKPVATGLTFSGKDFTLDLNGNTAQAITVSSGNVTIAYSQYGGSATSLTVNEGKAILNGGTFGSLTIGTNGTVEQNGATITGAANNQGSLTTTEGTINGGLISSKTLVLNGGTFKGATAVTVSGGTADIKRGTIDGTECGLLVSGGTATLRKLAVITSDGDYSANRTAGTLNVESGKFGKPLNGTINFTAGFFKTNNYGVSTEGKKEMNISAGVEYNEGYRYFLGTAETALANGVGVCRIGTVSYSRLEDALAYANNNPLVENIVIFMTNDYTLPAGYYTLPANATIVVPMSDSQEKEINMTAPRVVYNDQKTETPYTSILPTEFRRLTFASGVNMDVNGDIELTCSQYASNEAYTAQPCGAYGHLVLEEGSYLTLQNGSEVRAWGFVTGKGEMDARRGAKVREMFQLGDWKGAMTSVAITGMVTSENELLCSVVKGQAHLEDCDYSDHKIFPVTQYFIQNIESPVKYHPGAVLSTSAAVSEGLLGMSVSMAATDIAVVGVSGQHQAIFLMDQMADADNTWVRKWYDTENDIQVYDINSAAHIGSMVLDMGDINLLTYGSVPIRLNSAKFDLPLTSNFKIHLLSGTMDFQQNTSLLPGAEVEVDKEATVTVAQDEHDTEHTGALYVYDADEWHKYAFCNEFNGLNMVKDSAYTKIVRYAPSWEGRGTTPGQPDIRNEQTKPADAAINVHGTFATATGFVYCSEHGGNIFSSNEDAGTFIFNEDAVAAGTRTVWNIIGSGEYESLTFYPAKLKNGVADPEFANTSTAQTGDAYCYTEDKWNIFTVAEDPCFMKDDYDTYYAKPQDYVAVVVSGSDEYGFIGNADHTFSDAAGAGRLFILILNESGDCDQWWEVEKKDNLYHCIHPLNDTYYYWDESDSRWKEKTYTITWKNWNGDIVQTADKNGVLQNSYSVTHGTMAEFLGTNPTRASNIDYTYDFTGWTPALGPVTQDVTYTATYTEKPRQYTIIFCQEGGLEIERQFLLHNEVPACENTPTKIGYTLVWSPAIAAVTGDAVYTATWLENPPTEYAVTFYDYDGTTILQQGYVTVGEEPVAPAIVDGIPTGSTGKPATNEFTYIFDHWSPSLEAVSATSVKSYVAVYREVAKKYTVIFQNEDGSEIERHDYSYGETPVCSATPTRANTAEWTYGFAWTPQIQTVQAAATYRATFPATKNKYTVTLQSNNESVCTFSGAGIYDFGTAINVSATIATGYTFDHWDGVAWTVASGTIASLESDVTLTLYVKPNEVITDLSVAKGTTQSIAAGTKCQDFILNSDGSESASVTDLNNLTIFGNCYYDLTQTFTAGKWYTIAVPWQVVAGEIKANGSAVTWNSGNYLAYYDGAIRAAEGKVDACWHYVSNGDVLQPGRLYMLYLKNDAGVLRFPKKAGIGSPVINTTANVSAYASAETTDANWNGIANPATYYAYLNAGATDGQGQVYNAGEEKYELFEMDDNKLIVGQPIFVQAPAEKSIVANTTAYNAAPARLVQSAENSLRYDVRLTADGKQADRLIVRINEEKEENAYVIGQDLVKFGVSTKVAQMWIDRYDAKLCVNAVAPEDDATSFPMSLFAPKAGDYTIAIDREVATEDYNLYLTYNGQAIWNLSDGAYTLNLNKGTDANYGLRISLKAPQVTTGVDEAIVDAKGETRKVLINNQVFIIRGDKVYSIDGQLVK